MNLDQLNVSYIILSSDKLEDMISVLYAKDYQIITIKSYYKGQYDDSVIAFGEVDNNNLRKDVLFLLNHFQEEFAIIKYLNEKSHKKIFKDGSEKLLNIVYYNTDLEKKLYLYNGLSFSFVESVRYWKPTKKDDFKVGMKVEFLNNNNKWCEKKIENPSEEYEKLYKLLIKYDKIRVAYK
jgi:hypothetical protein